MKMKVILFLFSFLCTCASISAQETKTMSAKYCMTYADYQKSKWIDVDEMTLVHRTESQIKWWGGGDFQFDIPIDKTLEKTIKKKAFAVYMDDTLYVNMHNLKHKGSKFGSGYILAFKTKDGRLVFTERYVSRTKNMAMGALVGAGGVFGSMISGAAIGTAEWAMSLEKKVVYLIDPNTEKVLCLDQDVVPGLLEGHPELLDSYSQIDGKHAKRSAAIVFPLLVQSGFIICDMISGDNQRGRFE